MRIKLLSFLFLINCSLYSQSDNVGLISKSYGDSIVLRIVTTDYDFLEEIFTSGYVVSRQEIDLKNLEKIGSKEILSKRENTILGSQVSVNSIKNSKYYEVLTQLKTKLSEFKKNKNDSKREMFSQSLVLASNVIGATDINASKYLGIRFTDVNVQVNKSYIYYITMDHPIEDRSLELSTVVPSNYLEKEPQPILYNVTSAFEKLTIKWDRELNSKNYFVYDIERSFDGHTFEVINSEPILNMYDSSLNIEHAYYVDSVENYIPYQYRLIGWTYFADRGPASKTAFGMGIDNIPPNKPNLGYLNMVEGTGVVIQWSVDDDYNDLESFEVLKSHDLNQGFTRINDFDISKASKKYIDTESIVQYKNYYKVCAIDTAGNKACSVAKRLLIQDVVPPETPKLIESKIDSNGIVTIQWEPNLEEDLWGYYVYRTNDKGTNFLRVTNHPHIPTMFHDTVSIKTLTKSLFYTVAAIDVRANVSSFSDTISLMRPDKIAPSPALFVSSVKTDNGIELKWNPSPFADVVKQELHRSMNKSNDWQVLKVLPPFTNSFVDTSKHTETFKYKLLTIDDSGNSATSANVLTVKVVENQDRIEIKDIQLIQSGNQVKIIWDLDFAVEKLIVFKADAKNGKMKRYQILDCKDCTFWEESLSDASYKVQFKTGDGRYTSTSNTLTINN